MNNYRFSGYRIIEFSSGSKSALKEIADRLIPYEQKILDKWVSRQYSAWVPPGLSSEKVRIVFGGLLRDILECLGNSNLEHCISKLEETGSNLAASKFPYEALIISIHFLEESYMPYLLNPPSKYTQKWLIAMDEFLHAVLAALATAYFEAYRKELLDQAEVGKIVQESMLANIPKKTADLEIAHVYMSAQECAQLGGDFLDFFEIDENRSAFFIGDLSGHGLDAAADSVMLRSLFRGFMRENPNLPDAMSRLNRIFNVELAPGQFATALAIIYDKNGDLSLVSAGHPYPVLCEDGKCQLLEIGDIALGIRDKSSYSVTHMQLKPGAVLVAYTDGVPEARDGKGLFGEDRIMAAVSDMAEVSARAVSDHLIDEALRHAGGKFRDDVAVLVIKRRVSTD